MYANPTQQKFALLADKLVHAAGKDLWKRVRIAVTHEEYMAIQVESLDNGKDAFNMIRSVPIVCEEHPDSHDILQTVCPKDWKKS